MDSTVEFSRADALAHRIVSMVWNLEVSLEAALYRINNPILAQALAEAAGRGVQLRLVLDGGKFQSDPVTRNLLEIHRLPFRLLHGRSGPGSKMHHKFAILDSRSVITGSYNWTMESEEENYENLLVLRELTLVEQFREEFEALWNAAEGNAGRPLPPR